jgi:hypothetical protein
MITLISLFNFVGILNVIRNIITNEGEGKKVFLIYYLMISTLF